MYDSLTCTLKDFSEEVVGFLQSGDVEVLLKSWPNYLGRAMRNLPYCWSTDANKSVHRQSVMGNLYSALVWTQQALVFLERATSQSESELWKLREMRTNYYEQGKLIVSLGEARKKAEEKARLLESANSGLILKKYAAQN